MTFPTYEEEIQSFPSELTSAFREARDSVASTLASEEEFRSWADSGLAIARRAGRSWEAAKEYFRVSPEMVRVLPFNHFQQWVYWGGALSEDSPVIAGTYFRVGPEVVKSLKPWDVPEWAQIGRKLYGGGRRSATLCARFFESSGDLLSVLSFSEFQHLVLLVEAVAEKSADEAVNFLTLSREVLPSLREDTRSCLSLISTLVRGDWQQSTGTLQVVREALARIERVERARFLALAGQIAEGSDVDIPVFLQEGSVALGRIEGFVHVHVLNLAEGLVKLDAGIVPDFVKGVPHVLQHISVNQLEAWYDAGVGILAENSEGGAAFFRGESARSEEVLEKLSMGVELGRVKEVIRMYCRALSAVDVEIAVPSGETAQNRGWVALEKMMSEGATVYLPNISERFGNKDENFDWYKVVATHQVSHLEFESFGFSFDQPAAVFSDQKSRLLEEAGDAAVTWEGNGDGDLQALELPDLHRFFSLFEDGVLARDIFTAVEDCRLDHRVLSEYRGIRQAYKRVQDHSLSERPAVEEMRARESMVELLIRFSLQQGDDLAVPERYSEWAKVLWEIVQPLSQTRASVEDSAEATIRLYDLISQIPNEEINEGDWDVLNTNDFQDDESESESETETEWGDDKMDEIMKRLMELQPPDPDAEGQSYQSPPQVDYRGDFKPELMQLISLIKDAQKERGAKGESMTPEEMEQLLADLNQQSIMAESGDIQQGGMFGPDMVVEIGSKGSPEGAVKQINFPYDPVFDEEERGGPLEVKDPLSFLYDEWDYRMSDYRPRWCLLREKEMAEGDGSFYNTTLEGYSLLASQIKRQFEMVVPQGFQKMKRQQDGDEFELDAVIEAMVDKKSGTSPSEKVYTRRNKVVRDVAVAFLLDMSASTAEAIDESRRLADEWDAPDDPLEYMFWLRSRRGEGVRRSYKRIVDLEKESVVLLIHALETIGDTYGIYGFSGYGRENVDFFVIKDINEALSDKVKRRIDKVSPLQATRMGPAIRHTITKLEKQEARTKFFFLISDGRPQDRGYSREGVEKEYAIHDTRVALTEARQKGIIPFCLTVDKEGHDYLRAMCQDMGYEVLADIHALPKRLPALYRSLTI